uniref:Putative secreted protein n=1 Tax=Anopheles darlingi TaxID=43151 RepID=A0A2M4DQ82_ANODA
MLASALGAQYSWKAVWKTFVLSIRTAAVAWGPVESAVCSVRVSTVARMDQRPSCNPGAKTILPVRPG